MATELILFTRHDVARVRAQAVRAIAEFHGDQPDAALVLRKALGDGDPRVRHAGLIGLFEQSGELPPELLSGPARSNDG